MLESRMHPTGGESPHRIWRIGLCLVERLCFLPDGTTYAHHIGDGSI